MTQEQARHGIAEHHELDELIEELDGMDMSSPGWLLRARHLFERVDHHLAEEEHKVFQLAGKVLNDRQKARLGGTYREAMKEARGDRAAA